MLCRFSPRRALVFVLLFALPSLAYAAQAHSAVATMPTQPLALLQLGARRNGLTAPGEQPWHVEVTYQTYRSNGRRKATGTFEEWWAAPDQYHLSFDRKGYHLQAWVTPQGSFAIGDPDLPMPERLVYHWLIAPIPQHPDLAGARLFYRVRLIGPLQFPCVQIRSRSAGGDNLPPQYPTWCFESTHPMLRLVDTRVSEAVTVLAVGELRRQYLPQRLAVTVGPETVLTATLQRGESYGHVDPSFFTPPANAKPAPSPSTAILYLTAREAATHLISASLPHGTNWNLLHESQVYVPLAVSISTRGRVERLQILSPTDPGIAYALEETVRRFRYRPFLLHGKPAAVRTQIILDFRKPLPR
jgi:hypothetical protein